MDFHHNFLVTILADGHKKCDYQYVDGDIPITNSVTIGVNSRQNSIKKKFPCLAMETRSAMERGSTNAYNHSYLKEGV